MTENVIRFPDVDRKSRNPDACAPRDPAHAGVIVQLPEKRRRKLPSVFLRDYEFHFGVYS